MYRELCREESYVLLGSEFGNDYLVFENDELKWAEDRFKNNFNDPRYVNFVALMTTDGTGYLFSKSEIEEARLAGMNVNKEFLKRENIFLTAKRDVAGLTWKSQKASSTRACNEADVAGYYNG
jgi:hypothetical protein